MDTGLVDKHKKPIKVGSIIQYKLDGKGRGPVRMVVEMKGDQVIGVEEDNRGRKMTMRIHQSICSLITVLK
jgi:hypothetical protein